VRARNDDLSVAISRSVTVQPDWHVVDQLDFANLLRLRCTAVSEGEDM
jgi:hypothetical protein